MNILIIDENEIVRRHLFSALRKGHDLHEAVSRDEAQNFLRRQSPDVILMELLEKQDTDESTAVALVERLLRDTSPPSILIITRSDRKEVAAGLLALGVVDVFQKPIDTEELQVVLRRVERLRQLRATGEAVRATAASDNGGAHAARRQGGHPSPLELGILGVDPRIKQILDRIRRIAPTPITVLITGETGTGKEIFAQAVHSLSERRHERMVPLNCAVLSDSLVEDELFGHEKGAFTGAVERRKGRFEYANKGTLFLDEIGDMSVRLQAKFMRVLQERTFERLGGNLSIETDFRLVSATHRDLHCMTREGTFREDLMFRLNVVSFHIPPLRDRRMDIKLLAEHFLKNFAREFDRPGSFRFSQEVVHFLYDYHWPGNVRELEHFVERAVALSESPVIGREALPDTFSPIVAGQPLASGKGSFDTLLKQYKRQLVIEALQTTRSNKVRTAQLLGISKSYLFKLIKQLSVPA